MRIRRVVIYGFKTFARKTEFVFDPGVTAVVGPNGSGKSNIVDAVRWCLGEQSFSLLRSKKTSDVIFAGSDKKARLGMAEVSLTLDNSGGEIPIDYEEVEITRRAYRDGDNEYLVNGQRVRLQDVVDLLSHTGLGKRTYSVVGQGLIDRALSMAPEERRALFEEAAGITGYQLKRMTAMRRLDATQLNLTRVHDIVAELSPRLGYLRRQADRARERDQLARDLQALLRDWYGFRWHTALRRLEEHHAAETSAKTAVAERQAALTAIGARIETLRVNQAGHRSQLADLHAAGSGLHRQAEAVGRSLAVAQERLRQLQARQEDARRELAPLRVQQETLANRSLELHAAIAEAEAVWTDRKQAVDALEVEVSARQHARTRLQDDLDARRCELKRQQDQRADTAGRITQLEERRTAVLAEQQQQQQALAGAQREVAAAKEALHAAEAVAQQDEQRAGALQAEAAGAEARLVALRTQLRQAEEARQTLDRHLDRQQTRYDLLNRLRQDAAGYGSGVRTVLQAACDGGPLQGILGTVASLLRVPPQLEKAIEIALGGALQNVVAERWSHASAAIELLRQQRGGRATFLPLDRLQVLPAIAAPRTKGILGNAVDLVEFETQVYGAMQQLLNRVWVAQDLPAARAALDGMGGGPRPTVVTLDGEIIRPGGAVTGGSDSSRGDDSLLARERELRELPERIARATEEARQAARQYADLNAAIEAERLQMEQHQRRLAELAREDRNQRQRLEEMRRRLDRARQALAWQEERLVQMHSELRMLGEREAALRSSFGDCEAAEAAALQVTQALETQLAAAGADALLQELAHRRAAAAEAQGNLRSQQTLAESTGRSQQSATDQIAAKERQIAGLEAELAALNEQIAQASVEETELSRQLAVLQAEIDPIEVELSRLAAALDGEQAQERALQLALRREESIWNTAQLHLQRSEDLLHQLRGEIEHDLGLVTLEQSDDVAYQPPLPCDAFVEQLAVVDRVPETLEGEVCELRLRLGRLGNVNPDAPREYEEAAGRREYLLAQSEDLEAAAGDLQKIIRELDQRMEIELRRTFDAVATQFTYFFQQLFQGGAAHLELTDPEHIGSSGIEIIARPPGKRPQNLTLLSGGERALAACALIFAILRVSPTPFCVLDEVDAALDEANIDRFRQTLQELSDETQFIIVTHNRRTLEGANTIYGVTMGSDGVSRVMSLRLEGDRIVGHDSSDSAAKKDDLPPELEEVVKM